MNKITAVVGSRTTARNDWDYVGQLVRKYVQSQPKSTIYISGGAASGADYWIRKICMELKLEYIEAPAFWNPEFRNLVNTKQGTDRTAGLRRNVTIAKVCTDAVVFWDGKSTGTQHVMMQFDLYKKPYEIIRIDHTHPLDLMMLPKCPPVSKST